MKKKRSPSQSKSPSKPSSPGAIRLQKYMGLCGIASRRKSEELIRLGFVQVNGRVVTELGTKVTPDSDQVRVEGKLIHLEIGSHVLALNKPRGVMTTLEDPGGRTTIKDLLKGVRERVYPVGRLDYQTEGLILVTNDGDLANLVMHPRYEIKKVYLVKVKRLPTNQELARLRRGMFLEEGFVRPVSVEVKSILDNGKIWIEVVLNEGKNREIRRMFDRIRLPVDRLRRTQIGNITIEGIPTGKYRPLTPDEVRRLRSLAKKPS